MEIIKNQEFGGERPLFGCHNLKLENVTIHAGESALKECSYIDAVGCRFEGKYPFWHVNRFSVKDCVFTEGARAALWYSHNLDMKSTLVEAPKMFRDMTGIRLTDVKIPNAQETLWHCTDIEAENVSVEHADYIFMHCADIKLNNWHQQGNYSFQYCHNVEIHNAKIDSKDAFWNTESVTVYDTELTGEYLGWYSNNLRLVRCKISGTQPLCYCKNLILEDCIFEQDSDLAFEESYVDATVNSIITSVKNPTSGIIRAKGYGEIILDENIKAPANCKIETI
ncbi:MAG: DUF3737 family protein [Paramuribaculum sp.]|nr:DUF3737 family protein [Paramuribaculum sp.]